MKDYTPFIGTIKVKLTEDNHYEIHHFNDIVLCSDKNKLGFELIKLGIGFKEVFIALKDLEDKNHDLCYFGIYGGFLFSELDQSNFN